MHYDCCSRRASSPSHCKSDAPPESDPAAAFRHEVFFALRDRNNPSLQPDPPPLDRPRSQNVDQSPYPHRKGDRTRHRARLQGLPHKRTRRRERGHPPGPAATDLRRQADGRRQDRRRIQPRRWRHTTPGPRASWWSLNEKRPEERKGKRETGW